MLWEQTSEVKGFLTVGIGVRISDTTRYQLLLVSETMSLARKFAAETKKGYQTLRLAWRIWLALWCAGSCLVIVYLYVIFCKRIEAYLNCIGYTRNCVVSYRFWVFIWYASCSTSVLNGNQFCVSDRFHFAAMLACKPFTHHHILCQRRARRPAEVEGRDYFFVDKPQFEAWRDGGMLLEHALVYGEYKGIPRQQVRRFLHPRECPERVQSLCLHCVHDRSLYCIVHLLHRLAGLAF